MKPLQLTGIDTSRFKLVRSAIWRLDTVLFDGVRPIAILTVGIDGKPERIAIEDDIDDVSRNVALIMVNTQLSNFIERLERPHMTSPGGPGNPELDPRIIRLKAHGVEITRFTPADLVRPLPA